MEKHIDYFNEVIKHDPVNNYIVFTKEELSNLKENLSASDLKELEEKLQWSLSFDFEKLKLSVIEKKFPLPNINLRDYISLATYYWPDQSKHDGLPYISKDGEANPEGDLYDKNNLRRLGFITYYAAILYYLTDNMKYHDILVKNCTYYLLDDKTGMNPNMNHAQMIRGVNDGRGIGIVDYSANFTYALMMIKILNDSKMLDNKFYEQMICWHTSFLDWVSYEPIALEEKYAINNHGVLYDFLLIVLYDFLGIVKEIRPLVYDFIENRISKQIISTGEMPLETARTKSISYSLMGFKGMYDFAKIASNYGYDLWNINSWFYRKINVNLKLTLDYLYNHLVMHKESWNFKQITVFDKATLVPLIFEGKKLFGESYNQLMSLNENDVIFDIIWILARNV